jgi:hypothetical protein
MVTSTPSQALNCGFVLLRASVQKFRVGAVTLTVRVDNTVTSVAVPLPVEVMPRLIAMLTDSDSDWESTVTEGRVPTAK